MKKAICLGILTLTLVGGLTAQSTVGVRNSKGSSSDKTYNLVSESTINVTTPSSNIEVGSNFTVPVTVSDTTGRGIIAYQFDLHYNPAVIQPQANPVDVTGTLSSGLIAVYNPISPGILKVAVYGAYPLAGAGTLINFKFTAVGPASSVSPITWVNFMFNEGDPAANVSDGQIVLIPIPPSTVPTNFFGRESVSGRLDVMNNIYRDNTFVLVSNDDTNSISMTVSLNLAPIAGQPGVYNVVSGHWTLMAYEDGVYVGSIYGDVFEGKVTDTLNNTTGQAVQRKTKADFRIVGGLGRYENAGLPIGTIVEFSSLTSYLKGKNTTGVLANIL
jgi:Cohesin domain